MLEVNMIPVGQISPSPMNPRKTRQEDSIKELSENIRRQGLLQPITVRPTEYMDYEEGGEIVTLPSKFEIVCGERRFRALKMLADEEVKTNDDLNKSEQTLCKNMSSTVFYDKIPCIVRDISDDEALDMMITENLQREDVDPMEEANAFALLREKGRSLEDIAAKFGKNVRFVADRIRLGNLIDEWREKLKDETMTIGAAMLISKLDKEKQKKLTEDFIFDKFVGKKQAMELIFYGMKYLKDAPWKDNDHWQDSDIKPCSECEFNTSNQGCLFYEMKNKEDSRCMNENCFNRKNRAYILRELSDMTDINGIDKDGKTFLIASNYCMDTMKQEREKFIGELESLGYKIMAESDFGYQFYGSENTKESKKAIQDGELIRCVNVFGYYGPKLEIQLFRPKYNPVAADGKQLSAKEIEKMRIKDKISTAKNNAECKMYEKLRDGKTSAGIFLSVTDELSEKEKELMYIAMLKECAYFSLKKIGVDTNHDDMHEVVSKNKDKLNGIVRQFIFDNFRYNNPTDNEGTRLLYSLHYPEEFKKIEEETVGKAAKRIEKMQKELDALDGEKE